MSRYLTVALRDVLSLDRDEVAIDPSATYRTAGVRSFGRGLFARPAISGAGTSYSMYYRLRKDQVVFSRLFAWEGAVALVPPQFDGWFVSSEFPTFTVDRALATPAFLGHFARWPHFHDQLGGATRGLGQRRQRVHVEDFLALKVPLPDLDEQSRVASKLDRCHHAIQRAAELAEHADDAVGALQVSTASRPDLGDVERLHLGWRRIALGKVMAPAPDLVSVASTSTYPNVGVFSFGRGLFEKPPIDGMNTSAKTLNRIRAGQFIYSRLFAFEGSYAYVPERFDGCFVSGEFPTFDPDPDQLDACWLSNYLRSPDRWSELGVSSKGLGQRRQRVPAEAVLAYEVWLPPIDKQREMVKAIERADAIAERRRRVVTLSSALTPSLLNQAFAGMS